jgi:hypothetical protein
VTAPRDALPGVDEQILAAGEEQACLRWLRDRFELSDDDARRWLGAAMTWVIA